MVLGLGSNYQCSTLVISIFRAKLFQAPKIFGFPRLIQLITRQKWLISAPINSRAKIFDLPNYFPRQNIWISAPNYFAQSATCGMMGYFRTLN